MKRVPPSVRLKEEIEGLLGASETAVATEETPMVGFVGRLARYMLQVAIEAEATVFLGRGHYRRGDRQRAGSVAYHRIQGSGDLGRADRVPRRQGDSGHGDARHADRHQADGP